MNRFWPDERTVWRWHFYAGLFCIPFVIWLGLTGCVYLFKPQIDAVIDRPYDDLPLDGATQQPSARVAAALAAVPGSRLQAYELPGSPNDATRVLLMVNGQAQRVYVQPANLHVMKIVPEEARFERIVFKLHGQLLLGNTGSVVVELAASWAVVMIATGLFLWWPRGGGLAGVLYPRLSEGGRRFWRDLHAVTGFWVSAGALFLLISGLPWSYAWGNLLKLERGAAAHHAVHQDWEVGAVPRAPTDGMVMHADAAPVAVDPAALDRVIASSAGLGLAAPALVQPPQHAGGLWTARSDSQNRTLRDTAEIDGQTGRVVATHRFGQHALLDRIVGIGVSAHEGQLFGWINQMLGLLTALGLVLVSISAVVLWSRRRPHGVLGAPPRLRIIHVPSALLIAALVLGVLLPELGISALLVLVVELLVLRRIPAARHWLGLEKTV